MEFKRIDGRAVDQVRPIKFQYDALGFADASILFEMGNTKVFVSVTLQKRVPLFLRGSRTGWLTAEYSMLPCATQKRTVRDSNQNHKNARGVEISRLIGRSLRTVVDLSGFGEKTIIIDCDVLQADGGTRVACLNAACMALGLAEKRWLNAGIIKNNILKEQIAAISVGVVNGVASLDISFDEDSQADADFNFIFTKSGKIIEIQGTAEKEPLDWSEFDNLKNLAIHGINFIFNFIKNKNTDLDEIALEQGLGDDRSKRKPAFFSLANREPSKSL